MSIVVTKEIKRRRLFLAVFAVLVSASAALVYFGIFKKNTQYNVILPLENPANGDNPTNNNQVSDLKVKILEDERFKNLLSPPGVPLKTETTGKSNPFSD